MGSSRASTPASGRESPEPLTPRSKIKALLAAVDNSDDEASGPQISKILQGPFSRPNNLGSTQDTEATDEESDEEIRPRGRLAARMHAAAASTEEHKPATETRDQFESNVQQDIDMIQPQGNDEDEDDILPVAPRRLFRRTAQDGEAETEDTPAPRSPSPGLFVSSPARPSPTKSQGNVSDTEEFLPALKSDRFKALVERKKQERRALEAAEEERNAERRAMQEKLASELEQLDSGHSNVSDITDDEGGLKLTQGARPTRKASKKAVEDMNRETQRMARNMQLAHEAKTRKKISKSSLFERFNFRPAGAPAPKIASSSRPTTPPTDAEKQNSDTPPSSPPVAEKELEVVQTTTATSEISPAVEEETPALDKGKGKEVLPPKVEQPIAPPKRNVRVKMPPQAVNLLTFDSDDELEITGLKRGKVDAVFNNVPKQTTVASHSMQALRALAQLRSPGKDIRRKKTSDMSVGELQFNLHQKARQQAKVEREKRMEMLKAQGIVVQTAEERERQMQEVDDIVAKAREEAEQIMAQERAEAKKNKGENDDPLDWDESDDEEYQASADEGEELADVELSGSEEENGESDEDEEMEAAGESLVDEQAAEDDESGDETIEQSDDGIEDTTMADDDDDGLPTSSKRRSRKQVMIVSDDDEDDEVDPEATPRPKATSQATPRPKSIPQATPNTKGSTTPGSVLRSARKNFIPGLPVKGPAGLGLTQIFAGTMDDSQMSPTNGPTQSMMPDFDNFPDSNFSATMDEPVDMMTQTQNPETQGVQLNLSQSQMRGLDSLLREVPSTQYSEMMEPSQDGGFQDHTPLKDRFIDAPHSTVETVVANPDDIMNGSPLIRRGRLRRKMESVAEVDEVPPTAPETEEAAPNAFGAMLKGAEKARRQKLAEEFNKKKSKAKEMVEEQAEESEDEYRGLGGADGEDSDDESVASVKEMIDDAAGNDLDESKLAAYYADQARASDEKQVEKLFKDITSGMLRRKRGADYDLSDSDDGGEARRKMKRRQFAKMQKALFTDERVKKMAENPGNQAFLRTIEDHGSDEEMDFLDVTEEPRESPESQSQEEQNEKFQVVPDSQPRSVLGSAPSNRPPAHMRRTKAGRKPTNIGEVRETLSSLLEDGREMSIIPATEAGSDSENEDVDPTPSARSDKENHAPNPRRRGAAVVDRISLKRNSSSMISDSGSRMAFAVQNSSSSFKVPALLRRATTNSLQSTSTNSSGTSTPTMGSSSASGFGNEAKIKKTASKKSGINAFARETERRAKIQENERRRQEKKVRGAENRLGVVGGLLGKNAFQ
ncbi:unnamed protein product [Clonostachys solani]|uniref:DNA replication checkpoint mediator MRC1 domain-containing protein n=1 Tax=Clonostachys solani TaxID=160281 RepID=A0A9N9ZLY4_9HYPO|nr:unnamed protein product [Clonostachys solani]